MFTSFSGPGYMPMMSGQFSDMHGAVQGPWLQAWPVGVYDEDPVAAAIEAEQIVSEMDEVVAWIDATQTTVPGSRAEAAYESNLSSTEAILHTMRKDIAAEWSDVDDALCEAWLNSQKVETPVSTVPVSTVPVYRQCNVPGCTKERGSGPRCYECQKAVPPCPGVLGQKCPFTRGGDRPMLAFDAQPGSVCNCCFKSLTPPQQVKLRDEQWRLRRLK